MRKLLILLAITVFSAVVPADVVMSLSMPRQRYMIYEPVIANLALRNTSGQGLIFGHEAEFKGYLEIGLFDMHNCPLKGSGTKINLKGLILRPGTDHQIRVNVGKWLDMRRAGFYKLKMYISHPMLKNEYESNFCTFDITAGQIFWQRKFGIPNLQGAQLGEDLKMRSYIIKTLQNKSDIHFYLFVEDNAKVYAVKYLGMLLGREIPTCEIDSLNQLHILLPEPGRRFCHKIFDWHGNLEKQSYYKTAKTIPILHRQGATGDVSVIGGELIVSSEGNRQEKLLPDLPADTAAAPAK
ncbi:MAG: hypothetical protein J6Q81_04160 [Lentisphaeria bacterium]|nr:hypothetical protein [Lentisphaeria bacterium]